MVEIWLLPVSTYSLAWLLQVKDFIGTEEKQDCEKAVFIFRFFVRDEVDEMTGVKEDEGVRNDFGVVAKAVGFTKEVGIVLKA